jgi:hypothetical protein
MATMAFTINLHYMVNKCVCVSLFSLFATRTCTRVPRYIKKQFNYNPAEDIIHLKGFDNGWLECSIYNRTDNKLILRQKTTDKILSIAFLAKGIYFLKILDQKNTLHNFKLIKN